MADSTQSLFEVAVLHRDEKGKTTIVVEPKTVLAKSAEVARLGAVREVPAEYDEQLDELEVIVKSFR